MNGFFLKLIFTCTLAVNFVVHDTDASTHPLVEKVDLQKSSVLIRIPKEVTLPPVILYHGFGAPSDKMALMNALPLDDVPAIKVYVDLPLFGDRMPDGGLRELAQRQRQDYALEVFAPAVLGAVNEHNQLVTSLAEYLNVAPFKKTSVFGFSAGGAVVLALFKLYPDNLHTVIALNAPNGLVGGVEAYERVTGLRYQWNTESRSIAEKLDITTISRETFSATTIPSLLVLHAENDEMLPLKNNQLLIESLNRQIDTHGEPPRVSFHILPNTTHHWVNNGELAIKNVERKVTVHLLSQ